MGGEAPCVNTTSGHAPSVHLQGPMFTVLAFIDTEQTILPPVKTKQTLPVRCSLQLSGTRRLDPRTQVRASCCSWSRGGHSPQGPPPAQHCGQLQSCRGAAPGRLRAAPGDPRRGRGGRGSPRGEGGPRAAAQGLCGNFELPAGVRGLRAANPTPANRCRPFLPPPSLPTP